MSRAAQQPPALRITVATDHPALAGHFPGSPILPGVLLLDAALHAARADLDDEAPWEIRNAKFIRPVRPGETVLLRRNALADGSIRFVISGTDGSPVSQGVLVRVVAPGESR